MQKIWPLIVRRCQTKKPSIERLIQSIKTKIEKQFVATPLTNCTNGISKNAAIALWRPLESNEIEIGMQMLEKRHQTNLQSYKKLIDELCSLLNDETLQVFFYLT